MSFRITWNRLVVAASALLSQFAEFVSAPPAETRWFSFGKFLVAVAIGLWVFPTDRLAEKRHQKLWFVVAVVMLLLSVSLVMAYSHRLDDWTIQVSATEKTVIGSDLTSDARALRDGRLKRSLPADDEWLLRQYANDARHVWLAPEINRRADVLVELYLLTLFVLASVVISVSQLVSLSKK